MSGLVGDHNRRANNVSRDGSQIMRKIQKPKFYCLIIGGENTRKVKIPSSFRKEAKKALATGFVNMIGPSGVEWAVTLCEKGEHFEEGWESFFDHNKLVEKDFLLFTVVEGSTIEVEVFRDGLALNYEQPQNLSGNSDAHLQDGENRRMGKDESQEQLQKRDDFVKGNCSKKKRQVQKRK